VPAFAEWDPVLATGDSDVDAQHMGIFALVNEMHDLVEAGHGREAVDDSIDRIASYVHTHFAFEEELMERIAFPEIDEQVRQHRAFTDEIDNLRVEMVGGELVSSLGMLEYMRSWLIVHIGVEDRKIGEFIRSSAS
jgi:hemerythrin-like metal-binding protein